MPHRLEDIQRTEEMLRGFPIIATILQRLRAELPSTLTYHTAAHTDDVFHEVILFAMLDDVPPRQLELLAIGAAYHDSGFLRQMQANEVVGAGIAAEAMRADGSYSDEEIRTVVAMIEDTLVRPVEGGLAQIPSQEISKYLLDADLSNVGREDFFDKSELVRTEIGAPDGRPFWERVLALVTRSSSRV